MAQRRPWAAGAGIALGLLLTTQAWAGPSPRRRPDVSHAEATYAARPDAPGHRTADHADPHAHHHIVVATGFFVGEYEATGEAGHSVAAAGVRLAYEHDLIPGWLDVEVVAGVAWSDRMRVYPVDLVLKMPFHPTPWLAPYIGLGVGLTVDEPLGAKAAGAGGSHGVQVAAGPTAALGAYFWIDEHVGVDVEVDYAALVADRVVHEVIAAVGLAVRL